MDPFQANLAPAPSIPPQVVHRVAVTFGLTVANVTADARDVAAWHGPEDVLLHGIEHRRRLPSASAAAYLKSLRTALSAD